VTLRVRPNTAEGHVGHALSSYTGDVLSGPILHSWRERAIFAVPAVGGFLIALGTAIAALATAVPTSFWIWWTGAIATSTAASVALARLLWDLPDDSPRLEDRSPPEDQFVYRSAPPRDLSWIGAFSSGHSDTSELISDFPAAIADLQSENEPGR
jgi:hypothetical protein